MEQITDNPFRSISPLNLDTQITNQELPRLVLPATDGEMDNISERSFKTAKTYRSPSPSVSISSSITNIDESLMMNTIDNLRNENAKLIVENIILETENNSLKIDKEELYSEIEDWKKKCNPVENQIIVEEVSEEYLFPTNAGLYILFGGSITTCAMFVLKYYKNY